MPLKLRIMSDIHTEFHKDLGRSFVKSLNAEPDEVAIVAGDISSASYIAVALKLMCEKFSQVVMVLGNHEYYGSSFKEVHKRLAEMQRKLPNLRWLSNSWCEIEGKRIHGSTLWFEEPVHLGFHKFALNDYHKILQFEPDVYQWHKDSREYLSTNVRAGDVVVTHHAPSYDSIHARYSGNLLNCMFATHMDSVVVDTKPLLWIHGHTHSSFDYYIEDTRVICNPFGYASYEENPDFQENLVVVVPT